MTTTTPPARSAPDGEPPTGSPQHAAGVRGPSLAALVALALSEDLGDRGDVTTRITVPRELTARASVVSRASGVFAGRAIADEVLRQCGLDGRWHLDDGAAVAPGSAVVTIAGPAWNVLTAERTLLNFTCRLSGIATLTRRFVEACAPALVLDTRKTTPAHRELEKAAVVAGGGTNHRHGLFDRVLVKDNHLALTGMSMTAAVDRARSEYPDLLIEVEADDLDGVRAAAEAGVDWILLDNMSTADLREAVAVAAGRSRLEASGGMTLDRAAEAARTGVDAISVGALTHSAPSLDLGLDITE
ncbi:MAG: carboxylating nicotinate-nucleotide diphosphorylase [Thermoleophilia bacterium]|nr:carboxylating nicotinate-nucleotide diphosphorylase [Thermoleophilia bacterium]